MELIQGWVPKTVASEEQLGDTGFTYNPKVLQGCVSPPSSSKQRSAVVLCSGGHI